MKWVDHCVDYLIGGESVNITGLAGSGRSRALDLVKGELDRSDWRILHWKPATLPSSKRHIVAQIDGLLHTDKIPVLIIDDYGEIVCSQNYRWLDAMLFARMSSSLTDTNHALRCIVTTYPRDRRITTSDGSGLLERARRLTPEINKGTQNLAARFGCTDADALLNFAGGNAHLLKAGGNTPNERRGNMRSLAAQWLPRWIGQLDEAHQIRLAEIIERGSPASWRSGDADPILAPLVVPYLAKDTLRCKVLESIEAHDILSLLVGQPWVYGDAPMAAKRFFARCGNEKRLLWVDNYLSELDAVGWRYLVNFLVAVCDLLGSSSRIDMLSRDWISGRRVDPDGIRNGLHSGGLPDELRPRLRWRIYDRRRNMNLHERQLILQTQGTVFKIPPIRDVIGLERDGNEQDAPVALANSIPARDAWKLAQVVL